MWMDGWLVVEEEEEVFVLSFFVPHGRRLLEYVLQSMLYLTGLCGVLLPVLRTQGNINDDNINYCWYEIRISVSALDPPLAALIPALGIVWCLIEPRAKTLSCHSCHTDSSHKQTHRVTSHLLFLRRREKVRERE
jgi:hypothetical protein